MSAERSRSALAVGSASSPASSLVASAKAAKTSARLYSSTSSEAVSIVSVSVIHLPVSFVLIAAAAAERHVLGNGEVVDFVVDQNHTAELS